MNNSVFIAVKTGGGGGGGRKSSSPKKLLADSDKGVTILFPEDDRWIIQDELKLTFSLFKTIDRLSVDGRPTEF